MRAGWADSASLDLLRYIGRHAATGRLLVVVTYRDDHHDPQHPALHLMPHLVREAKARRLELHPLTLEQIRELIDALYSIAVDEAGSLIDYLYTRAEGNPFFTLELLRDLELKGVLKVEDGQWHLEPLPEMPVPVVVRQIIESRLRWLDDANFALLDVASIIGQEVPIDLWQDVSGASDDEIINAVEQARDLHIASETTDRHHVRFTHGLIRETFYRSKSAMRRRKQHRKVAEALISRADPAPGLVAHHFTLGDDPRAISCLILAGEHAARMFATEDAISYFTEALAQASHHQQAIPIPALRGRAHGYEVLGKFDLALRDLTEIRSAADRTEDRNAEWRALLDLGMLWTGKDYQQAGTHFNDAYNLAHSLGDQTKLAHSINRIANWNVNTGQSSMPDIIAMHQEALSIFEAAGDKTGIADTLDLLGMTCYLAGRFGLSAEYETRAIALSREMDDKARLLTSLTALAVNGGDLDVSFDAGVAASKDAQFWIGCAEEALAISRQTGWKSDQAFALTMLASLVSVRGDPGQGLRLANEAQEIAARIGHQQWISASALVLGRIWAELLDYQRAEYYLERCRASSESTSSYFWTVFAMSALANLHAEAGRIDLAGRFLEPYVSREGTGRSNTQRSFQLSLGAWKLAAGEAEEALKIAD
jgi:tetratricopeptide (TPR) repeat protein